MRPKPTQKAAEVLRCRKCKHIFPAQLIRVVPEWRPYRYKAVCPFCGHAKIELWEPEEITLDPDGVSLPSGIDLENGKLLYDID